MDIDARSFGQLEGEVKALHAMLLSQNVALAALKIQMDQMNTTLSEAKGGWKTLMWLSGVSGVAGGFITWLVQHFAK